MPILSEEFLRNKGGVDENDLSRYINLDSFEIQYPGAKTKYLNVEDLKVFLSRHKNILTILSLNIESMNAKFDEFKVLIDSLAETDTFFSVICIQEAWLNETHDPKQFELQHYNMYSQYSNNECSKKGGLITYVRNNISVKKQENYNKFQYWEGLFIDIEDSNKNKIKLGNIYRPPKGNNNHRAIESFLQEFCPVINNLDHQNHNFILAGDFNIDLLKVNINGKYQEFYDFITEHNMLPNILLPTRLSKRNATLIDNIFSKNSNSCNPVQTGILVHKLSDHLPTMSAINFNTNVNHINKKQIQFRAFTGNATRDFLEDLHNTNWDSIFDNNINADPQITYDQKFSIKLDDMINKHFPLKKKKFNKYKHKKTKWITQDILNKIKHRDMLYKKVHSITQENERYNDLSRRLQECSCEVRSMIRRAKSAYYLAEFNKYKDDIKNTWKTIKDVLNKSNTYKEFPKYFNIKNKQITDTQEIAAKFNDFFVNIGPTLAKKINTEGKKAFQSYLQNTNTNSTFHFTYVDDDHIKTVISKLNPQKSAGADNISLILLKLSSEALSKPLTAIINQSLKNGIFPNKLKIAKVKPIFKKDDQHDFNNYRPISLLPSISKVFERVVHTQLFQYFTDNALFYNHQYGFRKNHSTETAVLELIDRLKANLDENKIPVAVFLDLSKAFDTIDHNILLKKLEHYGILHTELQWFSSYLSNRIQYVEIENTKSPLQKISTGVPQGSILGPLLFLIYINDLHTASNFISIMYADDTNLLSTICNFTGDTSSHSSFSDNVNKELTKVSDWLAVNKLSLNVDKTKFMIFHTKQKQLSHEQIPNIKINNQQVERVKNFKFLGVLIDHNLTWNNHVTLISNKLSRTCGILAKLKNLLPKCILQIIYNALFLSHLNYGITAWGFHSCSRLIKLQKKAVRLISKSKYNAHTSPIFKSLGLLKVTDIFKLSCMKLYFKYENNMLPSYFNHLFNNNQAQQTERPRRVASAPRRYDETEHNIPTLTPTIPIIVTNTKFSRLCIRYIIPDLINENYLPEIVISKILTHSFKGFTQYAKKYIINNYETNCNIVNCYICTSNNN